jgi:AmmeMemoRadiSam system protein A
MMKISNLFYPKDGRMSENLSREEKQTLLRLAREALECAVRGKSPPPPDPAQLTPLLRTEGAAFVTLTVDGQLRGCVGALQPYQSLADDVREHAIAAALQDYRFQPVNPAELPRIRIEISRLTLPQPLAYTDANDLLAKLRPGVDGVILRDDSRRATFLPQVWEQLPDKEEFLGHLCAKMGASPNWWMLKHLNVQVYQVEEFHE